MPPTSPPPKRPGLSWTSVLCDDNNTTHLHALADLIQFIIVCVVVLASTVVHDLEYRRRVAIVWFRKTRAHFFLILNPTATPSRRTMTLGAET